MEAKEVFRRSYLCSQLSPQELDQLLAITSVRNFSKGALVFLEGDHAVGFYLLLSGTVRIYKSSPEGREFTLHKIHPGQTFAEAAIFYGEKYPANCVALEDSVAAFFPKESFVRLISESPQISVKMIGSLAQFLRDFSQTIEMLSLKEVSARLATYLLRMSERTKGNSISLAITKTELADKLGTVSETLSRNLRKISDLGVIEVEGRTIKVLDPTRLQAIADGEKI